MNLRSLLREFRRPTWKKSYAQSGEDLIVAYLLRFVLQVTSPTYLDIGAHHPYQFSNTYYFYKLGFHGVCVEPNPLLHEQIKSHRPRDTCLNVGIGSTDTESADFYVVNPPTMSTFSGEELETYLSKGFKLVSTLQIPLVRSSTLIEKHFDRAPNFVSIDTEGYDLAVLEAWDFLRHRPDVFCVETVRHVDEAKIPAISQILLQNGYLVYADTYINTIYVESDVFARRQR